MMVRFIFVDRTIPGHDKAQACSMHASHNTTKHKSAACMLHTRMQGTCPYACTLRLGSAQAVPVAYDQSGHTWPSVCTRTCQNAPTNAHIPCEGALLVDVGSCGSMTRSAATVEASKPDHYFCHTPQPKQHTLNCLFGGLEA